MRRSIAILCVVLDALMVRAQTDVDTIVNVYQLGEVESLRSAMHS